MCLLHQFWMLVAESIRALCYPSIVQRQMHQSHPCLRHGLMITSLQIIDGGAPRRRQRQKPSADFDDGLVNRIAAEVEVSDLDVITMRKRFNCARFKSSKKFFVGH